MEPGFKVHYLDGKEWVHEYLQVLSHNSGLESDYPCVAISQEENLWNNWNFCKSVQKQNKLMSSFAHKCM